ncbi:MAG: PDC sensor domain-containing protein [Gammaproteobacteria bacterium]|nr:PDC sensor domain-containing protein [Gammaproteobacteria bacterium]
MSEATKTAVARQRLLLQGRLATALARLVGPCGEAWGDREALERLLAEALAALPSCKYLYVLDQRAHQITANVSPEGPHPDQAGRDRSARPYMAAALAGTEFSMSSAYISRNRRRPTLTAVQRLTRADGTLLGFLGADFDLRELPLTRELYQQPDQWMQLKGDPAIRGGLFNQQRVESLMDARIDEVLDLVTELVAAHGVFHGKLHFSSSRATLWLRDDPFRYRLLDYEDLTDPGICLAYPQRAYPDEAVLSLEQVAEVFHTFRDLRFMDETIYLRSGSLNIFNGMVGLNFSCDGSHYMGWHEFLGKRLDFWLGAGATCAAEPAGPEAGLP